MNMDRSIQEIPIEDIIPNRFQPRLAFNEEGINELAESIKQHGIIQPIVVRRLGDKYEIIAGERRYKASTMAGLTKVPVIISDIDDNQSAEVALVENIQRRNLTAIEEAKSYKNLLDRGYMTQEQLADKMGVSQSTIANKLRLLNLDEEVQDALLNEKISERHARSLLSLEDKEEQKKWLQKIINERLTVRQLDMEIKKSEESTGNTDEGIPLVNINPNLNEIISNAEDIKPIERPTHDVASMLIPKGGIISDEEPKVEEKPQEIKEEETEKVPNKFFNFLEDEEANMSVIDNDDIFATPQVFENPKIEEPVKIESTESISPFEELLNPTPQIIEEKVEGPLDTLETLNDFNLIESEPIVELEPSAPIESQSNTSRILNIKGDDLVEEISPIIEEPVNNLPITEELFIEEPVSNNTIEEIPSEPTILNEQPIIIEETPFKSIFFNQDENDTSSIPVVEPSIINEPIDNTIEEIKPIIEENIIDPLDMIDKLEPDYEQKQEELAGTDLKTAINTIRNTIKDLENRGFVLEMEEADLEDVYHITIKIDKNNL